MCLNTRSNNIHNTDRHVIKNFAIGLCSEKKNGQGKVPHGEQVKQ